jgi:hypothetical protein
VRRLLKVHGWRRIVAATIGISFIIAVGSPGALPARGDSRPSIAVNTFTNEAGVPQSVVNDLSGALYRAVSSSATFASAGGGPLPYEHSLTDDPFADALAAAGKAGADYLIDGSVVQNNGGTVYYRLSLYKVTPLTFVASQVFAQGYPPPNAGTLSSGMQSNVSTLMSPRQAVGTIYSTNNGVRADVGTGEGFALGEKFWVTRNGQNVAQATITSITDDEAVLSISDASNGYSPEVGDGLLGMTPLPPALNAPPAKSGFDPLAFVVGVGAVLLAIGHHGQPATPGIEASASPSPGSTPFYLVSNIATGTVPNETITFTFSQLFSSATATGVTADETYAYYTLQPPGNSATTPPAPLASLGETNVTTTTGTLGQSESVVSVGTSEAGLVTGEPITFTFTTAMTDQFGDVLAQTQVSGTLEKMRKSLSFVPKKSVGPVVPGPQGPVPPKPLPPKGPPTTPHDPQ